MPQLYTINADGGSLKQLTSSAYESPSCPSWMPDSRRIVSVIAPADLPFPHERYDIWVLNADGSGTVFLTDEFYTDMLPHCVSLFG